MKDKYISIVIGTRPEAIKLAPLILAFKKIKYIKLRIILTGQHKEMVSQVMDLFKIKASINLDIMTAKQSLNEIANLIIVGMQKEIKKFPPDLLLVQGDTNSAFITSLAAFYEKIPIGHIEAGLRSNNLFNPFPEEANRKLISQIASLHFAPTRKAFTNLELSDVSGKIFLTGNTVIDSLKLITQKNIKTLEEIPWKKKKVILVTIHRRENWGENLLNFIKAIKNILKNNEDTFVLLPMHLNSIVRDPIKKELSNIKRIKLTEPLRYDEFAFVLKNCYLIITDSGGVQEEAPTFKKPVLIIRYNTEREEAIENNTAKLVGVKYDSIVKETNKLIRDSNSYKAMTKAKNPFGDGNASKRIVKECQKFLDNLQN